MASNVYRALVALNSVLMRVCTAAIASLLGVIVVIMAVSVLCRYLLNNPLSWSDDACLISLVWMTLLGLVVGMRQGHIAVEGLLSVLPSPLAKMVNAAVYVSVFFIAVMVVWVGFGFVKQGMARIVPSLDWITQGYVYLAVPVGFLLIVPLCVEQALRPFFPHLDQPTGE